MLSAGVVLQTLFIGFGLFSVCNRAFHSWREFGDAAPRPALYGSYEVESFARSNDQTQGVRRHSGAWRKIFVDNGFWLELLTDNNQRQRFILEEDIPHHVLRLAPLNHRRPVQLKYQRVDSEHILLSGSFEGADIQARLRRDEERKFPLLERGFHWINESFPNW